MSSFYVNVFGNLPEVTRQPVAGISIDVEKKSQSRTGTKILKRAYRSPHRNTIFQGLFQKLFGTGFPAHLLSRKGLQFCPFPLIDYFFI